MILKMYDLNSFLQKSECVVDLKNMAEARANVFKQHLQEIEERLKKIDEAVKALDCSSPLGLSAGGLIGAQLGALPPLVPLE